jgi:Bacterial PH domain
MAMTERPGPSLGIGIVIYLIAFALVMALSGWRVFSCPGVTTYRIYRDRIESEEGLVNRQRRTVLIGRIIDVQLTEGVLQRTQGAGTVTLVIQPLVSQGQGNLAHQTIRLGNIPQPREVYDLIRSLALDRKVAEEGDLD